MPRDAATVRFETRTARLKLPVTSKPIFLKLHVGLGLAYRRNATGAGTWVLRVTDGKGRLCEPHRGGEL